MGLAQLSNCYRATAWLHAGRLLSRVTEGWIIGERIHEQKFMKPGGDCWKLILRSWFGCQQFHRRASKFYMLERNGRGERHNERMSSKRDARRHIEVDAVRMEFRSDRRFAGVPGFERPE